MKITNTAPGPRGVPTKEGTVFLEPGETRDLDVDGRIKLYSGLVKETDKKAATGKKEEAE